MKLMVEKQLVSVIVPVFNNERYIDDCIQSITNQSYEKFEIILINDGSTDNTSNICEIWGKKDKRVKVYNNRNHGVSFSRNFGLRKCSGNYITFVDSDDIIAPNYIENLVYIMEKNNADMAMLSYCSFKDGESVKFINEAGSLMMNHNLEESFFTITQGTACSKLYKKSIIQKYEVVFDETIVVSEDLLFNLNYVFYCGSLVFTKSKLYGYRQRADSAIHSNTSKNWLSKLKVYNILSKKYVNNSVYPHILYHYLKNLYEANYLLRKKDIFLEYLEFDIYSEIDIMESKINYVSYKKRLNLYICKYFFFVVEISRKI